MIFFVQHELGKQRIPSQAGRKVIFLAISPPSYMKSLPRANRFHRDCSSISAPFNPPHSPGNNTIGYRAPRSKSAENITLKITDARASSSSIPARHTAAADSLTCVFTESLLSSCRRKQREVRYRRKPFRKTSSYGGFSHVKQVN